MKKIQMKTLNDMIKDTELVFDYKDQIQRCLDQKPVDGFTVNKMRELIKISDKVEKANGSLSLEDTEYAMLVDCVENSRWALKHKFVVEFYDDIMKAE